MKILGVDFTSAPRKQKPITVAIGALADSEFWLEAIEEIIEWPAYEALLMRPGPWVGGFDFPFGLPREAVVALGWPLQWDELVRHCRALGRAAFRATLDAYRITRAVGERYAHRATDAPAVSHSPLKLVNPPVGLMFLEGVPRLLDAGVSIPGLHAGDPQRIALEAYPALSIRSITRASYKSDERAKHTPARLETRAGIVAALVAGSGPFERKLRASHELLKSLELDASGDRLDAVVAAMQAAMVCNDRNFKLPELIDPLEGWIILA